MSFEECKVFFFYIFLLTFLQPVTTETRFGPVLYNRHYTSVASLRPVSPQPPPPPPPPPSLALSSSSHLLQAFLLLCFLSLCLCSIFVPRFILIYPWLNLLFVESSLPVLLCILSVFRKHTKTKCQLLSLSCSLTIDMTLI